MDAYSSVVSIIVISYNSSAYVIETLESIKSQTYDDLELIVSDDCSNDNTVHLVDQWLSQNQQRFIKTKLVVSSQNLGVSGNINQGVKNSLGKWIKIIAADDCLVPEAISTYVSYAKRNCAEVCASGLICIDENSQVFTPNLSATYNVYMKNLSLSLTDQRRILYSGLLYPGPVAFQTRESFDKIGGCDANYMSEEWPLQFMTNIAGYRVHPISQKLVLYRVSSSSLCRNRNQRYYLLLKNQYDFYVSTVLPKVLSQGLILLAWHNFLRYKSYYLSYNNSMYRYINIFSPIKLYQLLRKIFMNNETNTL